MVENIKSIEQQVNRYVELGFHKVLDQSEAVYRASFRVSHPIPQPALYRGRLGILVAVDPRIPTYLASQAAGIYEWISSERYINAKANTDIPYAMWTHDGSLYLGYSPKEAVRHFIQEEEGVNLSEELALYFSYPEFFRKYTIVAGETTFGKNNPYISTWGRKPAEVFLIDTSFAYPRLGVLSRGKEVFFLGS